MYIIKNLIIKYYMNKMKTLRYLTINNSISEEVSENN